MPDFEFNMAKNDNQEGQMATMLDLEKEKDQDRS